MSDKTNAAVEVAITTSEVEQIPEAEILTIDQTETFVMPSAFDGEADERPPFRIADDDVADWAIKKILEARAEYDRLKDLASREISRINEKVDAARRRYEADSSFLTDQLSRYFDSIDSKAKKATKTTVKYKLLNGTLTMKKGGTTFERDDAKLLEWLAQNGHEDMIRVKREPAWGDLKKQLEANGSIVVIKSTGEIVEGIEAATAADVFSVDN